MRIISQNGMYDIPYENTIIYQKEKFIMFVFASSDIGRVLASYSSSEKAEKAMKMLHNEYQYILELFIMNGNGSYRPEFIFQFPVDKDVEV